MKSLLIIASLFICSYSSAQNDSLEKHGHVKMILVFDVSGSSDEKRTIIIKDALITALEASHFESVDLAILGSSVTTTRDSFSFYGQELMAMNFVGFPKESVIEQQIYLDEVLSIEAKLEIMESRKPISLHTPNYRESVDSTLIEISQFVMQRENLRPVFRRARAEEMFFAPVVVSLLNDKDFLKTEEGKLADLLVVLYVADSKDQSGSWVTTSSWSRGKQKMKRVAFSSFGGNAWNGISPNQYLAILEDLMGGDIKKVFMGGVFRASDLPAEEGNRCMGEGHHNMQGSDFEYLINKTANNEAIISACESEENFNQSFARLFEIIKERVDNMQ